jgi:hypothetical protein
VGEVVTLTARPTPAPVVEQAAQQRAALAEMALRAIARNAERAAAAAGQTLAARQAMAATEAHREAEAAAEAVARPAGQAALARRAV